MLHDKTAVVYGGGGVIGGAVACELAREGAAQGYSSPAARSRRSTASRGTSRPREARRRRRRSTRSTHGPSTSTPPRSLGRPEGSTSRVLNGFSDLVVEVYGEERGLCARSAIGTSDLPLGMPVEVEAVVAVRAD